MNSIVALKPDGVLLPGADPNQFLQQLKQLQDAKIPISANGDHRPGEVRPRGRLHQQRDQRAGRQADGRLGGDAGRRRGGLLRRARAVVHADRARRASTASWPLVCPSCKARHVDIPIGEIGKSAPSRVVSDLQAHPNTKVAVFATAEAGTGLPAALKAAQLQVKLIGFGPPPAILGYIKQGQWDAAVGVDGFTMIWAQVDALARMVGRRTADRRAEAGAAADPDPRPSATSPSTRRRAGRRIPTSPTTSRSSGGRRHEARVLPCRRRRAARGRRGRADRRPRRRRRRAARARGRSCSSAARLLERVRAIAESGAHRIALDGVRLAPPVQPRKFFAIGLNYADHVAESGQPTPEHLTVFIKACKLRDRPV